MTKVKDLSLYIHIPFCRCICTYCAFLTYANKEKQIPAYVDTLLKETEHKSGDFTEYSVPTIYFGGGTPGLMESGKLEKILKNIRQFFRVDRGAEISIECNPENITHEKVKKLKEIGFNRLTMGVQSLKKETLFKIARLHSEHTIFTAIESLKAANFKNFGIDLIMGLPHQTFNSFKEELDKLIEQEIPHISCYFLSYDTPKIDTFIRDCPSEEEQIRIYNYACKALKKAGYNHYEVSNFSLSGFECRHNLRYWNQKEYLGLGLGAHSYINGTVQQNISDFDSYLSNPLQISEKIVHDDDLNRMDYIMLHLRQHSGIDLSDFQNKFAADFCQLINNSEKFRKTGHLEFTNNSLNLTEKGFLIIDKITNDLI